MTCNEQAEMKLNGLKGLKGPIFRAHEHVGWHYHHATLLSTGA